MRVLYIFLCLQKRSIHFIFHLSTHIESTVCVALWKDAHKIIWHYDKSNTQNEKRRKKDRDKSKKATKRWLINISIFVFALPGSNAIWKIDLTPNTQIGTHTHRKCVHRSEGVIFAPAMFHFDCNASSRANSFACLTYTCAHRPISLLKLCTLIK